jgi:large subunit ribosomal protein L30
MAEKKLKITQVRSVIDRIAPQKRTIQALGLGRPGYSVVKRDTPQVRGMIRKVVHLVEVEEVKA